MVRGGDIMNFSKKSGKKRAAIAAVVCFVAAIAITGTYTFNDYKKSKIEKELAMAEEESVVSEIVSNTEEVEEKKSETDILEEEVPEEEVSEEIPEEKNGVSSNEEKVTEEVSVSNAVNINFNDGSMILWPIAGELLMDYSMDKTVYFKTLDQYKYNPALVIAAAENDQIIAGAAGIVKSIDNSAQTGTTVNVDLGNGYEAFYGQLQNVLVKTGEYVEATTALGYVAEPTKYYSSEGTNVYFEMRKDGQPVNPKEYLTDYVE